MNIDTAQRSAFDLLDSLQPRLVAALMELVAIPSVAGNAEPMESACSAISDLCADAGLHVERWETPGAPVLFAEFEAPAGAPTVLFYGHYDVQPADHSDGWDSPPFEPTLRDGAVYGRGAGDNKGQLLPHIFAFRALSEAGGCPVGFKLLIEGEEEVGSPHLNDVVAAHADHLACDLAVTADGPYHRSGAPLINLGVRGLVYIEVEARGARRDLHSGSNGGTAATPARDLVLGLARLWDAHGDISVPGFLDNVEPPTAGERALLQALSPEPDASPETATAEALMFRPNLNICGISSGYDGPGVKTIVPHRAGAKLDARLVGHQDPEHVYACLHDALAAYGLETRLLASVPPSSTAADTPYLPIIERALESACRRRVVVNPRLGGTTPDFVFTRTLGVPSLLVPYGPPNMHHHAANERMAVEALRRASRCTAAICLELAAEALTLAQV